MNRVEWNLSEGCNLLTGVEHAARQLILEMDRHLGERATVGRVRPETKGITVVCIMTCAYYCEVSLKTLESSLTGGFTFTGHDLAKLWSRVDENYSEAHGETLGEEIQAEIRAHYSKVPLHWWPSNVRQILELGARSFEEWRYGFQENKSESMANAAPRQLYAVAAGAFTVCLKRNPELWADPGVQYLLPNPDGGFRAVAIQND